eukprot:15483767-Alexandrium_andersonii.AAC.1
MRAADEGPERARHLVHTWCALSEALGPTLGLSVTFSCVAPMAPSDFGALGSPLGASGEGAPLVSPRHAAVEVQAREVACVCLIDLWLTLRSLVGV